MPTAMVMELPGVTTEDYDRVTAEMDMQGPPDGAIAHICMKTDEGLRILDVWESREAHDTFVAEHLRPAMQAAGFEPRGDGPQEVTVHRVGARDYMPAPAG